MISKLITQYLGSNRRLILPTLGAFIKKDDSGEVVFVPYLKSDDGIMKSLIASNLSVSNADAEAMLEEFIFTIKQSVAQQNSFVVEGLGTITKDANGVLMMNYDPNVVIAKVAAATPASPVQPIQTDDIVVESIRVEPRVFEPEPVIVAPAPTPTPAPAPEPKPQSPASNIVDLEIFEQTPVVVTKPKPAPEPIYTQPVQTPAPEPVQRPEPRVVPSHASQVDRLYNTQPINPVANNSGARTPAPRQESQSQGSSSRTGRGVRPKSKPRQNNRRKDPKRKLDIFMIVAIIAIIAGLLVLLYDMLFPAPDAMFLG